MEPLDRQIDEALAEHGPRTGPARILILADERLCAEALLEPLRLRGHELVRAVRRLDGLRLIEAQRFEIILLDPDLPDGDGYDVLRAAGRAAAVGTKTIVLTREHTAGAAVRAMRCGAADFINADSTPAELADRVEAALYACRVHQSREERLHRLKRICEELNTARHEISEQVDVLCHDLVCAYQDLNAQLGEATMATEFRTLVRQELDVEDLLRTSLEYALTKTGPTNAAVFLPTGEMEGAGGTGGMHFGLGAYVNFDCPRETVAAVLERLCEAVCPQMAAEGEIVSFQDSREFADWLGLDSGMLGESQVIAFSCLHEGECMAIIVLFRARTAPFEESLLAVIEALRPIFAEQLARVVKVHHRARPHWPDEAPLDDADDEYGFDDPGYGFGGLAA